MKKAQILYWSTSLTIVTFLSVAAFAEPTYTCLYGTSKRIIKVEYENPDSNVPCSVVYEKDTGSQVLWSAQNVGGYCEAKATEFVEKQKAWGWDCTQITEAVTETSTMDSESTPPSNN